MKPKTVSSLLKLVQAADPTYHGWIIVEDVIGVDPFLLCEWIKEGAEDAGPLYQIDAGEQTAWAYQSTKHGGWLVADTTDDQPRTYTGPLNDTTLQVVARLVGDDLQHRWLFEDDVCAQTLLETRCCYG